MKLPALTFLILFLPFLSAAETDFREQFYHYFNRGDFRNMESTLKTWKDSAPNDVEMLAAYGSFYFNQARRDSKALPGKLTAREEILLSGDPPGEKYSGPNPEARFDRKRLTRAADYWRRAVAVKPGRMDIRFWLARAYQDLDNFEGQYQTLAEALQYADKNKNKLRWSNNEPLPARRSQFIPESMQDFEAYYFARQQAAGDEKAFRLAKLTLTFYPQHPYAYNSMAAYFCYRQDWERTLKYLILASQKDPKDPLILNNIGNILLKLDKKNEAKVYFEKVLKMEEGGKNADHARRKLEELKTH